MKWPFVITAVVAAAMSPSAAHAAELHGVVTDQRAKPVVAQVTLRDDKGAPVGVPVTTDKKSGAYAFADIKPGSYVVVVERKSGCKSECTSEWKIFVGPGETRRDLALK